MMMCGLAVALVATILSLNAAQAQFTVTTNPPSGSTVETLPAMFQCLVQGPNGTLLPIQWLINDEMTVPLSPLISEGLGAELSVNGENLTIRGFPFAAELPPPSVTVSCAPPNNLMEPYASFTLIIPPIIVVTVGFQMNLTAAEETITSLCVNAQRLQVQLLFPIEPFPLTVELQVLPESTATAGQDYVQIQSTLTFQSEMVQCFNVTLLTDDDDSEDVEFIQLMLANSSSPNAQIIAPMATVRIACNENATRLISGVDSAQGRVEICHQQDWRTICTERWDDNDARVVCRQLGHTGSASAYTNAFGLVFGSGGNPVLRDVECLGTESNLLNCSNTGFEEILFCMSNAGVDCQGRREPSFMFQQTDVAIAEGSSYTACVILENGVITVPFEVVVRPLGEFSAQATIPGDFQTDPPLDPPGEIRLPFSPEITSQCFMINTVDDSIEEPIEESRLGFGSGISNSLLIQILDNDMDCGNGSVCVNLNSRSVSCIPAQEVCNGFFDCPDNSDEINCPDICDEGMYTCRSDGRCLDPRVRCDSYPDCVTRVEGITGLIAIDEFDGCSVGCTEGAVDLLGGLNEREGAVRICANGSFVPVSAEGLSIVEASVLCQQLGVGEVVGYASNVLNVLNVVLISPAPYLITVSCPRDAIILSQCTMGTIAVATGQIQAALTCINESVCSDGDVRLAGGPSSREGRVEVCFRGLWGAVRDTEWTNGDAAVVCRQLGYPSQGAMPIYGAVYSNEPLPFVGRGFTCFGNESQLIDCTTTYSLGEFQSAPNFNFEIVGARCDDYQPIGCNELDVRLTYRNATGFSGQFEICSGNTWQRTCSNNFDQITAGVACRQLFPDLPTQAIMNPGIYIPVPDVISETADFVDTTFSCMPDNSSLLDCDSMPFEDQPCRVQDQPTVTCASPPVVHVSPELLNREYTVEAGYFIGVQCANDPGTFPLPRTLSVERARSAVAPIRPILPPSLMSVPVLSFPASSMDTGTYFCVATSSVPDIVELRANETVFIQVLEGEGVPDFAVILASITNTSELLAAILRQELRSSDVPELEDYQAALQRIIREEAPGVQRVNCAYTARRPVDIERRLDRIECQIIHFNRPDETEVVTAAQIAQRAAAVLQTSFPLLADVTLVESSPQVAFTSTNSTAIEGDIVTVCLAVVSGEVTTPTNITLTSRMEGIFIAPIDGVLPDGVLPDGLGGEPLPLPTIMFPPAFFGADYTVNVPYSRVVGINVNVVLTLQPGDTQTCFDVITVNDLRNIPIDFDVEQLTFSYLSSSPIVTRLDLQHTVFILDNDRNCSAELGQGSRICLNTEALMVSCIDPVRVCDFVTADCPDESDELNCPSPLEDIVDIEVSEDNFVNITATVASAAVLTPNRTFLQTMNLLMDISTVLQNIANFTNTSGVLINQTTVQDLSLAVNSLIQWQPERLTVETTSMIVEDFETIVTLFAQQTNFTEEYSDFTIVVELGTTESFAIEGRTENFTAQAGVPASISLPPELFNEVPADRPVIGVYFALYENPALLPTDPSPMIVDNVTVSETIVGSPIVAATVGPGINFGDIVPLDPPVVITLGLLPLPENSSNIPNTARCTSWDFETVSWTTEGCTTEIVDDETFRCSCTHLTNFAILVDICLRAQDCDSNPVVDAVLSAITYVGVGLSCFGLVITVISFLIFKKLRERDNSKYHIQLCIAIFCMLIVFAVGIEQIQVYGGCIVVSILIHYFSLVAVMWMGAEALLLFQKLVIVFVRITKKFIIIISLVCWLLPLIPVLIPMIIDLADGITPETDLIINRNVSSTGVITGGFCFHKHPGVFFGAFLGPILAVVLFNIVIFIWVIVILVRHTRGKMKRTKEKINSKTTLRLLVSISGIAFLFGLIWIFAAFTFTIAGDNVVRTVFQILFTVFATFQGFFIFLFFVIFNKEARESWRELLSCGHYKSNFLNPSQQKNTSSAGTRAPPTIKAKSTGITGISTSGSSINNPYSTKTFDSEKFDSEASPLPEKRDLSKENRTKEIALTSTDKANNAEEANVGDAPDVVESTIDEEEVETMWSEAEPVLKARVKRYSTKKVSKHHVEQYELDFDEDIDQSDDEVKAP